MTGINLFRFAIIAALPEPAYGPTHGLLSRCSTEATCCPPLANFAQLSMFRFDGLKIQIKLYYRQQTKLYFMALNTYVSVFEWKIFLFRRKNRPEPVIFYRRRMLSLSAVDAMLNHNANDGQWLVIAVNDRVIII
jgi:hypothetical protein